MDFMEVYWSKFVWDVCKCGEASEAGDPSYGICPRSVTTAEHDIDCVKMVFMNAEL